jgi:histone chaperone ASF1
MSLVNITNIQVSFKLNLFQIQNNPTAFTDPFSLEITFELLSPLQSDLEFKLIYVGSAKSDQYDQLLESVLVGPVPIGMNRFVMQVKSQSSNLLPG